MRLLIMIISSIIAFFPINTSCKINPNHPQSINLKKTQNELMLTKKSASKKPAGQIIDSELTAPYLVTKKFHTDILFDGLSQVSDLLGNQQKKEKKRLFFSLMSLIFKLVAQMTKKETRSIQNYDSETQIIIDQIVSIISNQ